MSWRMLRRRGALNFYGGDFFAMNKVHYSSSSVARCLAELVECVDVADWEVLVLDC